MGRRRRISTDYSAQDLAAIRVPVTSVHSEHDQFMRQLTYAVGGDFHHWICAIAVTKKQVTLNFHFGALLADPEGAFRQGTSKFIRMLDYTSPAAVDAGLIARRVGEAGARLDYFKANWQRIQAVPASFD